MSIKIKRCFDKIVDHQNLYPSAQQTTLKGLRFKPHGIFEVEAGAPSIGAPELKLPD